MKECIVCVSVRVCVRVCVCCGENESKATLLFGYVAVSRPCKDGSVGQTTRL
jgi:hypothetical protein